MVSAFGTEIFIPYIIFLRNQVAEVLAEEDYEAPFLTPTSAEENARPSPRYPRSK